MSSAYLGDYRAIVKTLLGSKIFVSTKDREVAPHLMVDGEWEAWMTRVMHPYLRGAVFLDVGANYGWYCLVAKHAGARKVIAFEPNPHLFEMLVDTMKLNAIDAELHDQGVGNTEESLVLHVDQRCPGSSSMLPREGVLTHLCDMVRLDDVMEGLYQREPELQRAPVVLKADVEGFEAQVVLGAKKILSRRTPSVTAFIEHHHYPAGRYGFTEMLDFFEANGFVMNLVEHDESVQRITREHLSSIPDAEMLCFRRVAA